MTWMAWMFAGLLVLVCLTGIGLYYQLRDALALARSWRDTAILEGKRAQANLNLAEFAVRQLDPSEPLPSLEDLRHLRAVD